MTRDHAVEYLLEQMQEELTMRVAGTRVRSFTERQRAVEKLLQHLGTPEGAE